VSTGPQGRDALPGSADISPASSRIGPKVRPPSAEDREQEQETLYVLQNRSLMEQIERSLKTHGERTGYRPSPEEQDALDRV